MKQLLITLTLLLTLAGCAPKNTTPAGSVPRTPYALSAEQLKQIQAIVHTAPCPFGKLTSATLNEVATGGGVLLMGCQ